MPDTWTIRLPYARPPLSLNDRGHWRGRAARIRQVRASAGLLIRAARVPACGSVHVTMSYVPRDGRRRDADNLVATLKPCIDAMVDCGVVPDDAPEYVTWSPPVIEAADPHDPHLYLTIERTT